MDEQSTSEDHLVVLALHELDQVDDSARITELIVVPRDQFHEVVVQRYASFCVEDAGVIVADEIGRDNVVLSVSQDTFQRTVSGLLHFGFDSVVGSGLGESNRQVDHGHVVYRYTEGHASKFSVEGGNNLANCLGGSSCSGNNILCRTTAITPQLLSKKHNK